MGFLLQKFRQIIPAWQISLVGLKKKPAQGSRAFVVMRRVQVIIVGWSSMWTLLFQAYDTVPSTPLHTAHVLKEEEHNWDDVQVGCKIFQWYCQFRGNWSFQALTVCRWTSTLNSVISNSLLYQKESNSSGLISYLLSWAILNSVILNAPLSQTIFHSLTSNQPHLSRALLRSKGTLVDIFRKCQSTSCKVYLEPFQQADHVWSSLTTTDYRMMG